MEYRAAWARTAPPRPTVVREHRRPAPGDDRQVREQEGAAHDDGDDAAQDAGREGLGRTRGGAWRGRGRLPHPRPALHRPAPRARGDEPAGLRGAASGRASGASARPDHRHGGPQHPDAGHRPADRGSHLAHADRDPAGQLRRVRCAPAPVGRRRAGHRPRRRPPAGPDPARPHRGLRRLPHLHPRRVRRPGVRHRHLRGRARPGHPDPAAEALQDHGGHRGRHAAPGCDGQGHHPRGHREDRHGRGPGLRARVPR